MHVLIRRPQGKSIENNAVTIPFSAWLTHGISKSFSTVILTVIKQYRGIFLFGCGEKL